MSRHESPELGDAIVRQLRALVTRAAAGDAEALEQLARIEKLSPVATSLAARELHDWTPAHGAEGHSFTFIAGVLGTSRQAVRQRVARLGQLAGDAHQLRPGHDKRTCTTCKPALLACEKVPA